MLLKQDVLEGIRAGRITLAFRRWLRPTVKTGGTLLTPMGQLRIEKVDPRVALRGSPPTGEELGQIKAKLARLDARAAAPWTRETLRLIERYPAVRAGDLAARLGMDRLPFKANVRKLKGLGLTVSLEVGYELSPRGRILLAELIT